MAQKQIEEIRIFPPLTFARMGGAPTPMENYNVEPNDAAGFRTIKPAKTLLVSQTDGSIESAVIPDEIRFKDEKGQVKPVAPFLELWVRYKKSDAFNPLTLHDLDQLGLKLSNIKWTLMAANRKMYRRTGDPNDMISAEVKNEDRHVRQEIHGTCPNFKAKKTIFMGWFQYIKATKEFPEIRVRITPPIGLVFGPQTDSIVPEDRALYDANKGGWPAHNEVPEEPKDPLARRTTTPSEIYAKKEERNANGFLEEETNLGYFDDTWDGILSARLKPSSGKSFSAKARIAVGPPDYAPDSFPVRTIADDLEQMIEGAEVDDLTADETIDIVRRVFETMQLMDTNFLNADRYHHRFANGALHRPVRGRHKPLLDALQGLHEPKESQARKDATRALININAILRNYDEVWDNFTTSTKMPALLRGADGSNLALTRRQFGKIKKAIEKFGVDTGPDPDPENRPTSFKLHILPLFTEQDFQAMVNLGSRSIDLTSYEEVKAKSELILNRLRGIDGLVMPPENAGGPWPPEWIEVFERWIKEEWPE